MKIGLWMVSILIFVNASIVTAAEFDVILKGGHLIDVANKMDGRFDVAIKDGKVATIHRQIDSKRASQVYDVAGFLVVPGLIDNHVHVFHGTDPKGGLRNGFSAVAPDHFSFRTGVTTMVDAGSSGWRNFEAFKAQTIKQSATRVFAFLNIIGDGMHGDETEQQDIEDMSVEKAAETAIANRDIIVGIKLAHFATESWVPTERAVAAGSKANIPVMVDFGHSNPPLSFTKLLLEQMRPGDILTHMFGATPGRMTIVGDDGMVTDVARKARARGILFDVGHGGGSFSFDQAVPAIKQGFYPDAISTDLHTGSMNSAMRDLPNVMSKLMALGLSLHDVISMTTDQAAKEIRHTELGQLSVGSVADVAVLRLRKESAGFLDVNGKRVKGNQILECEMTLREGRVVFDRNARSGKDYAIHGIK